MFKNWLIFFLFLFGVLSGKASLLLDSVPNYPFLNLTENKILQRDSSVLANFYSKMWLYEKEQKGKIKILHIGDSHLQAGLWSKRMRENFHHSFGCGTTERGFIFPYQLAQTNGPNTYNIQYTGTWQNCKSSVIQQDCSWGVSGISAFTNGDTVRIKVFAKNPSQENYRFNRVKLFLRNEGEVYQIQVLPSKTRVQDKKVYPKGGAIEYLFEEETDTLRIIFTKRNAPNATLMIQGLSLENDQDGISYSESGVNGAKLAYFVSSPKFLEQIKILNPDLLVLSFGTNDVFSLYRKDSSFVSDYNYLLYQLKKQLPGTDIVLTTPGDFKVESLQLGPKNQWIRNNILELAEKHGCAVWDWYTVMGGRHSINRWLWNGLCVNDKVHLSKKGYYLQGDLFYQALMQSYEDRTAELRTPYIYLNKGYDWKNFIEKFYKYDAFEPLLFTQLNFWIAFLLFFVFYLFVFQKTQLRSLYILIFSVYFYWKTGGYYISILFFSTFLDYYCGKLIYNATDPRKRKLGLWISVLVNLGVLAFFKYSYFFIEILNSNLGTNFHVVNVFSVLSNGLFGTSFDISEIILPVGISFYTFQTMSYSIDIYRYRILPVKNLVDFGFYVTFFPQLVAGPIVRANEFIPQIHQPYQLYQDGLVKAMWLIMAGLFKKIVISDFISANFVDRVFQNPLNYSGFENLMGVYGYALQIYCDFSAYSDIAIGLSLLMGFSLPENFHTPYLSANITDFWRRWHMSLSRWLKDYLYISLGGNKKGKWRTYFNLFLTMLLGGLWHGASMRFVLWGALHGVALMFHKAFIHAFPSLAENKSWKWRFFSWFITFHFVLYCWIFFRIPDMESYHEMMHQILHKFYWAKIPEFFLAYKNIFLVIILGYLLHLFPIKWEEVLQQKLVRMPMWTYPGIVVIFVLIIYQFKSFDVQPFIYFQF